jgi:hypothetical protein
LFALCAASNRSPAAEFFWVGGSGVWDDNPANWSTTLDGPPGAGVPGLLDPADIARLYNTGAADIEVTYQGENPVSFIPIDATGTGLITFSLTEGVLTTDDEQSARDGRAVFNHSGGTNSISNVLTIGRNETGSGQYNFSGGTFNAAGLVVGNLGAGMFNHTGGTATVNLSFQIAREASGSGTYNLGGKTSSITTIESFVGAFGSGTFNQTGGTHTVDGAIGTAPGTGSLTLAFGPESQGSYTLSGGDLQVKGNEFIGVVGQGTFTQTGGTHTIGSPANFTGDLSLAYADQFGQNAARYGQYVLDGGSLTVGNNVFVGYDAVGTFSQTQGVHTIGNRLALGRLTFAGTAGTPEDVIGNGTYNLSGGQLTSASADIGDLGVGRLNQSGGTYAISGQLTIGKETNAVGTVELSSGTLSAGSVVVGSIGTGALSIHKTGLLQTAGTLTIGSRGTVNLSGGTFDAQTIDHTSSGTFNFTGGTLHVSTFNGDLVNNGGTLAPGHSPGTTTITNSYTQSAAGATQIEIAGTMPGDQFDQINVTGAATLAGSLAVATIDGYEPTLPGQSFVVMTFASHTGEFDAITGQPSAALPGLFWTVSYTESSAVLSTSALPGDINLDGEVDGADTALFTPHLGTVAGAIWSTGDFDGDGLTTLDDLSLLQQNLGRTVTPVTFPNAIPEPATWTLVALTLAALGFNLSRCTTASGRDYTAPDERCDEHSKRD